MEELLKKANLLKEQHGICPALNAVIVEIAMKQATENTRKAFNKAYDNALKLVGYKPADFKAHARKYF